MKNRKLYNTLLVVYPWCVFENIEKKVLNMFDCHYL